MKKLSAFLLFCILSLVFAGCAVADDDEEEVVLPDGENGEVSDGGDQETGDSENNPNNDGDNAVPDADADEDSGNGDQEQPDEEKPPVPTNCVPGIKTCDASDPNSVFQCKEDGSGIDPAPVEKCGEGKTCVYGKCEADACSSAGVSYLGCDFYTAKLYNGRKSEKITSKDSFSVALAN